MKIRWQSGIGFSFCSCSSRIVVFYSFFIVWFLWILCGFKRWGSRSFNFYLPLVYPTFFLCVLRSGRSFRFRSLSCVGVRADKVFAINTLWTYWSRKIFCKTACGLTFSDREDPVNTFAPEKWNTDLTEWKQFFLEVNILWGRLSSKFEYSNYIGFSLLGLTRRGK